MNKHSYKYILFIWLMLISSCVQIKEPPGVFDNKLEEYASQGNSYAQWALGVKDIINEEFYLKDSFEEFWNNLDEPAKQKALNWVINSAENGFWESQKFIAKIYEVGLGEVYGKRNDPMWLRKAAKQGSEFAKYELIKNTGLRAGYVERNLLGLKKPRNEVEEARWYQEISQDVNRIRFMFAISRMYQLGLGINFDDYKAKKWFDGALEIVKNRMVFETPSLEERAFWVFKIYGDTKEGELQLARWLFENAENGSVKPQFLFDLANSLYQGQGLPLNKPSAYKWFEKAANKGYEEAMFIMGAAHESGKDLEKDLLKAISWYSKAAEKRHIKSMFALGRMLKLGKAINKNENDGNYLLDESINLTVEKALAKGNLPELKIAQLFEDEKANYNLELSPVIWYKRAANLGNTLAQYELGNIYFIGKKTEQNYAKALTWYERAAQKGYERAQIAMADSYLKGLGVKKSPQIAAKWLTQAAKNKNPNAALQLGKLYLTGKNVIKNPAWAQKWLTQAAIDGIIEAEIILGEHYFIGEHLPKDRTKALYWLKRVEEKSSWETKMILDSLYVDPLNKIEQRNLHNNGKLFTLFEKAIDQTDTNAQFLLAKIFDIGITLNFSDEEEATKWYEFAASFGNQEAQYELAKRYYEGIEVPKDLELAAKWMKEAADNGNSDASSYMGLFYINGYGVPKNKNKAIEMFFRSADKGNARAQYFLSLAYLTGDGIKQNNSQALYWLKKAAIQRDVDAINKFCSLYKNGKIVEKNDIYGRIWCRNFGEDN